MRALDFDVFAGFGVDVRDASGEAVIADEHFAHHGIDADFEIAGLHGREDMDAGRIEVGVDAAGAAALRAIVTSGAAVDGLSKDGEARRDAGDL